MLTFVITLTEGSYHDYLRIHRLHPAAARHVRALADLVGVELGAHRVVFWGEWTRLPDAPALLEFVPRQIRAA